MSVGIGRAPAAGEAGSGDGLEFNTINRQDGRAALSAKRLGSRQRRHLVLNVLQPTTWAELVEVLYLNSWDSRIERHRSSWAYRGVANHTHDLRSSLERLGPQHAGVEPYLLRNFRKYAHSFMPDMKSSWHWMTIGQHHGLPTRLLDWTWSPLVALHFATDHYPPEHDAAVWRVHVEDCHAALPPTLQTALSTEGEMVFTVETLTAWLQQSASASSAPAPGRQRWADLAQFDALFNDSAVLFLEPESIDARVVNQFGLFSVVPLSHPDLLSYLQTSPIRAEKIIVPLPLVREVRDYLDNSNINERVIYPGPDGLAKWLKRHYS